MDMMVEKRFRSVGLRDVKAWADSGVPRSVIDVRVTPDIAAMLLKYKVSGDSNRLLSRSHIDAAIKAMREDQWENTGEPIIMSDEGLLNDGQQRLTAIVESGCPCIMDLRFGIKRRAFAATNSGRKRSGADALVIAHVKDPFNVSAAARLAICYETGLPGNSRNRVGNLSIVAATERWPDLEASVGIGARLRKPLRNAATNTLAFFAMRTANTASVQEFFQILRNGGGNANSPPQMLHELITISLVGRGQDTGTRVRTFAACILAWNAWRKPSKAHLNLYWKDNRAFPVCEDLKL
jgi:hypothetical protein